MQFYIVGGYLRDYFLGIPSKDIDIVVEGCSYDKLLSFGCFKPIKKSFPVFKYKDTNIEVALCRKETPTGSKHTSFSFYTDNVSIIDDLRRRDFTCNAMALPVDFNITTGEITYQSVPIFEAAITKNDLIDPFNGYNDIINKELKVVDPIHFIEDPLRLLRFCRFLTVLNFTASSETYNLLRKMNDTFGESGSEFNTIVSSDRIFKELKKALEPNINSRLFIESMMEINLLERIFPELYNLLYVPENNKYHTSNTVFEHTLKALDMAKEYTPDVKFAILCHDIYKGVSYKKQIILMKYYAMKNNIQTIENGNKCLSDDDYKKYVKYCRANKIAYTYSHDSKDAIRYIQNRMHKLSIPTSWIKLVKKAILTHMKIWTFFDNAKASTIYDLLLDIYCNNFSHKDMAKKLLCIYECDNNSDKIKKDHRNINALIDLFNQFEEIVSNNNYKDIGYEETRQHVIAQRIRQMRISELNKCMKKIKLDYNII